MLEAQRPFRHRIHPVLPSEGDQCELKAVVGLREAKNDRYPTSHAPMPDSPSGQRVAEERARIRVLQDIREQIVDLIEATLRRVRVAGYVGDVTGQLPQIIPDERVPFDPDHA